MKIKVENLIYENSYPLKSGEVFEAIEHDGDYFVAVGSRTYYMGDEEELKDGSLVIVDDEPVVSEDVLIDRITKNIEEQNAN